jgi:hypothetical protein
MNLRRIVPYLFVVALVVTGFVAGRASADQPHMHAALDHLRSARAELVAATPDKGGHRSKALKLVDGAIGQVEAGIGYDRRH